MRKPAIFSDDVEDCHGVSRPLGWVALLDLSGRSSLRARVVARRRCFFCLIAPAGDDRSWSYVIRPHTRGLVSSPRTRDSNMPAGVGPVTVRGMHRLLVLYPPPSDPDHFRSYYEDTHLPLVAKFPGLRGYRYSFDVAAGEAESPYYCVFEADFDDAAALSAAQESTEGQAVRADVPNYATGGVVVLNYELRAG